MEPLYPVFLNLAHRTVLIAGGGTLAEQKLRTLAATGAAVVLIAPKISGACTALIAQGGHRSHARTFAPDDLAGVDVVFAATDSASVNHEIVSLARSRGILANAVDDPDFCDFYTPAVVRRGLVSVAISTDGRFPGVTRVVREVLDEWLPADDDTLLEALATLRSELRQANLDGTERAAALRGLIAQFRDRYLRAGRAAQPDWAATSPSQRQTRRDGTHDDIYIS